jgi:hypothetical protein
MTVTYRVLSASFLTLLAAMTPLAGSGDPEYGHHLNHRLHRASPHHHWHGDIRDFHRHDLHHWRNGHWYHGVHGGRFGWWWVLPTFNLWYLYSAPINPYPNPYIPPPVVQQAPAPVPNGAPPPQYWYFCESAKGYYPYVATCPEGWKQVPVTPPGTPAQ